MVNFVYKRSFAFISLLFIFFIFIILKRSPVFLILALPSAFNFERADEGVYIENHNEDRKGDVIRIIQEGLDEVGSFYGAVVDRPVFVVCITSECDRGISGLQGEKAKSYGSWIVQISSRGVDRRALAHELSHVELRRLIGLAAIGAGKIPAWYDEGLAVIVSRDDRYLSIDSAGQLGCLKDGSEDLPLTSSAWLREVKIQRNLYAKAACRVLHWMERNGGPRGVLRSIEDVRDGGNLPS